jgi:hypothetical protein
MKRLIATLTLFVLAGAGCAAKAPTPHAAEGMTTYENAQYRFAIDHPKEVEMTERAEDLRKTKYLGIDVDFFASLRDTVKEDKPLTLASFYVAKGLSVDAFKKALEASGPGIKVTKIEDMTVNGVKLVKVTSSTEAGEDKFHYLYVHGGQTLVIGEFLFVHDEFAPILATFRAL